MSIKYNETHRKCNLCGVIASNEIFGKGIGKPCKPCMREAAYSQGKHCICGKRITNASTGLCMSCATSKRNKEQSSGSHKSAGYVVLTTPEAAMHPNHNAKGYILEHVFVMSNHLGRPLIGDENVHHKNGKRDDNRLSNLELWSTKQPKGQRVSDKIKFALEIINIYGDDPDVYEKS